MIQFLITTFVSDSDNLKSAKVRERYGTLSSFVGIACNVLLFAIKFAIGTLANSIAITTDAFNNLSDSASSIITLFGYKQAAKPADRDHPFGHGRIEYLISLLIAVLIIFVGFEFLKTSFSKILHPQPVIYSHVAFILILFSIGLKLWMYFFNQRLGRKINSSAMLATSKDSLSDVVATSVTLLSLLFSLVSDFSIDGYVGVVVSGVIMYAGYQIITETIDTLLGTHADAETVEALVTIIKSRDVVLGVHDLIIHNYGPGKMLASCHVEVSSDCDVIHSHDQIDLIEKEVLDALGISLVIHTDPIESNNVVLQELHQMVSSIVSGIDDKLVIHDFRAVVGETHTNLVFDIDIPFDHELSDKELKERIDTKLYEQFPHYVTVITFDRSFL